MYKYLIFSSIFLFLVSCSTRDTQNTIADGIPSEAIFNDQTQTGTHPSTEGEMKKVSSKDMNLSLTSQADLEYFEHGVFKPRSNLTGWNIPLPLKWDADPYNDRNWNFMLQSWRMLDAPMHAYLSSEGEKTQSHLDTVLDYISDWYKFHIVDGHSSPLWKYDMAIGLRAAKLAFIMQLVNEGVIDEPPYLHALIRLHMEWLSDRELIAPNNHGIFQIYGLALICYIDTQGLCTSKDREYVKEMYAWVWETQYDEHGVHLENSSAYHIWMTDIFINNLRLEVIFGDSESEYAALLSKADVFSGFLSFPDHVIVRIGDSSGFRRYKTHINSECVTINNQCYALADAKASGYVVFRPNGDLDHDNMFIVYGTYKTKVHKHADDLSFELFSGSQHIFVDSGKYGYKNDDTRKYIVSPQAHSTLVFNENKLKIPPANKPPIVSSYVIGDELFVEGVIDRANIGLHERSFAYKPKASLVITDNYQSYTGSSATVYYNLHQNILATVVSSTQIELRNKKNNEMIATIQVSGCLGDMNLTLENSVNSVGYLKVVANKKVAITCDKSMGKIVTAINLIN